MTISVKVDLSAQLGQVFDQGRRPTCVAVAVSSLNKLYNKTPVELSPEFLYRNAASQNPNWSPGAGLFLRDAIHVTASIGQPEEPSCPYSVSEPAEVPPTVPSLSPPTYKCQLNRFVHTSLEVIGSLNLGQVVGLEIKITQEFLRPLNGLIALSAMALPNSQHAVIACGYGIDSGGLAMVKIRNSWGVGWGINGHAWVPGQYIDQHAVSAFMEA